MVRAVKRALNFILCVLTAFMCSFSGIQGKWLLFVIYLVASWFFWNQTMKD